MKISLIIPVYNVAGYIADCLESVYCQTYLDIEVVLVNDCTPDNSMEVADPYIVKLKERYRVLVINHQKNKGLSGARNTGVRAATGEYIYFLDSDDEITKECIELLVESVLEYPCVDFVIAGMNVVGGNTKFPIMMPKYCNSKREIENGLFLGYWNVMACNKLIRRLMFVKKDLWFQEGLLHEDELFSFKLAFAAQSMSVVNYDTYIYKVRAFDSITAQRRLKNLEDQFIINTYKFDYLSANYGYNNLSIAYIVNNTYQFAMTVLANTNISKMEKDKLVRSQLALYHSVGIQRYDGGISQVIKRNILSLPYLILRPLIEMHCCFVNK